MKRRRAILVLVGGTIVLALLAGAMPSMISESLPLQNNQTASTQTSEGSDNEITLSKGSALEGLEKLSVKGRAPKTGYERTQFGNGWAKVNGCSTRDIILYRDLDNPVLDGECSVISGTLNDLYTGEVIEFSKDRSTEVQIDHVVALSDAWQKGAQNLTIDQRKQLANDPLELIAASGKENQAKSDGDAATWLPKYKPFRCAYIARQIAVKIKYSLWVTEAERAAMKTVLDTCPAQALP
jgi:hypothetical protein